MEEIKNILRKGAEVEATKLQETLEKHISSRLDSHFQEVLRFMFHVLSEKVDVFQKTEFDPKTIEPDGNRKIIFFIDFGTFCDYDISESVLKGIINRFCQDTQQRYLIKYITTSSNKETENERKFENCGGENRVVLFERLDVDFDPHLMPYIVDLADFDTVVQKITHALNQLLFSRDPNPLYDLIIAIAAFKSAMNRIERYVKAVDPKHCKCILYHYGLLEPFYKILTTHVDIPTFILCYTPAYPNKTIPWVFDNIMKRINLFESESLINLLRGGKTNKYETICIESHLKYFTLISAARNVLNLLPLMNVRIGVSIVRRIESFLLSNKSLDSLSSAAIEQSFKHGLLVVLDTLIDWDLPPNVKLVNCWDASLLAKSIEATSSVLDHVSAPLGSTFLVRTHLSESSLIFSKNEAIDTQCRMFFTDDHRDTRQFIFVTFGSFEPHYFKLLCFSLLYGITKSDPIIQQYKILIHDQKNSIGQVGHDNVLVVSGFLLYYPVIRRSDVIFTSGSYCIANLCMSLKKKLVYFPILNEQYFWAKNYMKQTDVPFIHIEKNQTTPEQSVCDLLSKIKPALTALSSDKCKAFYNNIQVNPVTSRMNIANFIYETTNKLEEDLRTKEKTETETQQAAPKRIAEHASSPWNNVPFDQWFRFIFNNGNEVAQTHIYEEERYQKGMGSQREISYKARGSGGNKNTRRNFKIAYSM